MWMLVQESDPLLMAFLYVHAGFCLRLFLAVLLLSQGLCFQMFLTNRHESLQHSPRWGRLVSICSRGGIYKQL